VQQAVCARIKPPVLDGETEFALLPALSNPTSHTLFTLYNLREPDCTAAHVDIFESSKL